MFSGIQLTIGQHWFGAEQVTTISLTHDDAIHWHIYVHHYNDVIMSALASQISRMRSVYSTIYSQRRSKKTSKLRITGLCVGNSPVNTTENVSIWWHHNDQVSMSQHMETETKWLTPFPNSNLNEKIWLFIQISLKFVFHGPIDNKSILVKIMAWRATDNKPLSDQSCLSLLTHSFITPPQWVTDTMAWLTEAWWCHMVIWILVNLGSKNDLLSVYAEPSPEPMLSTGLKEHISEKLLSISKQFYLTKTFDDVYKMSDFSFRPPWINSSWSSDTNMCQ